MANHSVPVTEALALLDESSSREVTDDDLRLIALLLVAQVRQQVKRGNERAQAAQEARLNAHVNHIVDPDAATLNSDPLLARFDIEREENRVILEVAHQLRARMNAQLQAQSDARQGKNERTTLRVAMAGVVIASFVGVGQIVTALLAE